MIPMNPYLWWFTKLIVAIASLFFLAVGIETLVASYSLENPIEFVMYFFSSSMLIMVCIVGLIYSGTRIVSRLRGEVHENQ